MRHPVLVALRQVVGGGTIGTGHERAHLAEARVNEVLGVVDPTLGRQPATCTHHRSSHDAGRPDVAEHAALVTDPVHQPRFLEQIVELGSMLVRYLPADFGDAHFHIRSFRVPALDG